MVKNPPTSAGDAGDVGSISGSGRSPGGGTILSHPIIWRKAASLVGAGKIIFLKKS